MSGEDRRFVESFNFRRRVSALSVWPGLLGLFAAPVCKGALAAAGRKPACAAELSAAGELDLPD